MYTGSLTNSATWFPCGRGRTLFFGGSLGQRSRSPLLLIECLTTGSFLHDNFSSVYWIFTKHGHMIPLWKRKNPIYFGVITIIPFDNLYRRAYFVMHTFLVDFVILNEKSILNKAYKRQHVYVYMRKFYVYMRCILCLKEMYFMSTWDVCYV